MTTRLANVRGVDLRGRIARGRIVSGLGVRVAWPWLGVLVTSLALALASCSQADAGVALAGRGRKLEPGKPVEFTLDLRRRSYADFHVEVPAGCVALRWKLTTKRVELGLRTRRAATIDDEPGTEDFATTTDGGRAEVVYDRFTEPSIGEDRFHARVEWPYESRPRTAGERLQEVAFTIEAVVVATRVDGVLEPGRRTAGRLDRESGSFRAYTITVPEGTRALRLDITRAQSDLDLFAHAGGPFLVFDDSVRFTQQAFGRETLIVTGEDGAPLTPGTWNVDVVDVFDEERPIPFEILPTFDTAVPSELTVYPPIPARHGEGPLSRALAAVVEVTLDDSIGSGTILSPDGWILTNAHVVEGLGGAPVPEAVVAVTLDPHEPATELFRAEVRQVDRGLDMALLRVTKGFYGQPLPVESVLPWLELATSTPATGDTLFLVGYPTTGGQGSRVTVSTTRGIVAGFDTAAFGTVLKTDAEITSGNSGGAAIDGSGRLVGVPTSTVENGSGQIGYVHPIGAMPAAWRELVWPTGK